MVLASSEEHQGGSCTAHGREWVRPPVDTALRWGREEAEATGRLAGVWAIRWWWRNVEGRPWSPESEKTGAAAMAMGGGAREGLREG